MHTTSVRRRHLLKVVKELDAFPKVVEDCTKTTASGGGVSLMTFVLILVLVISEIQYYSRSDMEYGYSVDTEATGKIPLNVDLTVAMPCTNVEGDVVDVAGGRSTTHAGALKLVDTYYALTPSQESYMRSVQKTNHQARSSYHTLHSVLWQTGYNKHRAHMPFGVPHASKEKPFNACRMMGSLVLNKVAGNFHITVGKSVPVLGGGHAHLSMFVDQSSYNFSHRIHALSFGKPTPGVLNPLDGDDHLTTERMRIYQYFITIVPTKVETRLADMDTYQYSVTEQTRLLDHSKGSHGMPGIFFKYDVSPLKVKVVEVRRPFLVFLVRLCGIIGGVFATSGLLHNVSEGLYDVVCCRLRLGEYKKEDKPPAPPVDPSASLVGSLTSPSPSDTPPVNVVLS